jgi:hypothetical protein
LISYFHGMGVFLSQSDAPILPQISFLVRAGRRCLAGATRLLIHWLAIIHIILCRCHSPGTHLLGGNNPSVSATATAQPKPPKTARPLMLQPFTVLMSRSAFELSLTGSHTQRAARGERPMQLIPSPIGG